MGIYSFFKRFSIFFLVVLLPACGGGSGDSSPPPRPNISMSPSSLDFTGVVLTNRIEKTLTITNTGNANLTIGQIPNPSPNPTFSIATEACSNVTLSPSRTCSLTVRFTPPNQGSFTGTLSIPSNDPDSNVLNLSLKGSGYGLNVWINGADSSSCPTLDLDVTVTDPANPGTLLNSLTASNFKVFQNGNQIQNITTSAIQNPSPVSVVLALDFSESQVAVLSNIRAAAKSFIDLLTAGDNAAIVKFSSTIDFFPDAGFLTADASGKSSLKTFIDDPFSPGNATLLFTALFQSVDRAALGPNQKRAVIVLSDGIADRDNTDLNQMIANAVSKGIPIFTIYYVDPNYTDYTSEQIATGLLYLQNIASQTGGQYYNGQSANLTTVFGQIANVLSNKYTITYTSPTCLGTVSVGVQADWNNGSTVLHGEDSIAVTF